MSDNTFMNRDQFRRALKGYCKDQGLPAPEWNMRRGKGGHATVAIGETFTVVPSGELKTFTLEAILKQLGLPKDAV